jgi:hypothetical protein
MALKAQIESLEDVAEGLRSEYRETQDPTSKKTVYVLDIDGPIDPLPGARTLKDENARRRIENTKLTEQVGKFKVLGERDPNEILSILDRVPELEAAAKGKLDETTINGIVETRLRSKLAPIERERDQFKTRATELEAANTELTAKERKRLITTAASSAARATKVIDSALEDVELLAERVLEVDDHGNVVTRDGVGVTPGLSAKDWLADMQAKRPHWWGPSAGGGAGGAGGGRGGSGANPWKAETWNMTEQMAIVRTDRARADKLAQAAGTTVGGGKPKAKA